MNRLRWHVALGLAALLVAPTGTRAQPGPFGPRQPHIGYVYPAGGRQDDDFEVTVGGQFLSGTTEVIVSGGGVRATVGEYDRPLSGKEFAELQEKMQEVRERVQAEIKKARASGRFANYRRIFQEAADEAGVDAEQLRKLEEFRKLQTDPKRQLNLQLAEKVTLAIKVAPDAEPGPRQLRLRSPGGLSNPLSFYVGQFPEHRETEPNDTTPNTAIQGPLPVVVNGQILPGDVDRFRFEARRGERLVIAASARELMPYLADAVPGWFQATLALYDSEGNEVAYADDFRFHPDPIVYYEIPEEGHYVLEIKDAIYRGREDFVYRITLGEVPFVTGVFPLGTCEGEQATIELAGWNLPRETITLDTEPKGPGVHPISVTGPEHLSNSVRFAVDTLPESLDQEPNDDAPGAQWLELPRIVNGRIDRPGDWDIFRFQGHAGDRLVAEVHARRLGSPLDSVLQLTDAEGRQLALNDDHEDKGSGLTTHHADSRIDATLPSLGTYYLRLGDTQGAGGSAYGYRLRISPPRPDFELRLVPASVSARPGQTVPITVYALRKDGFAEDIALRLKDAPLGFRLSGAWVPAGQDQVRVTLTTPLTALEEPVSLSMEGHAVIDGRGVRRPAVPAEDMTQAFVYRHLVPADDLLVTVTGSGRVGGPLRLVGDGPVELPAGGTAEVRIVTPARLFVDQVELELSDPPEGITIDDVSSIAGGGAIVLRADADKLEPGLKGNLIVDAFVARSLRGQPGNNRRFPVGILPAIPFEIVPHP
jgi:hypothetical protein